MKVQQRARVRWVHTSPPRIGMSIGELANLLLPQRFRGERSRKTRYSEGGREKCKHPPARSALLRSASSNGRLSGASSERQLHFQAKGSNGLTRLQPHTRSPGEA
jgi:hypothetical protein